MEFSGAGAKNITIFWLRQKSTAPAPKHWKIDMHVIYRSEYLEFAANLVDRYINYTAQPIYHKTNQDNA